MTTIDENCYLRLTNGSLDPTSGRFIASDEHSRFEDKQAWYAYDRRATCELWFRWLNNFPLLDKSAVRDFFRRCACPARQPRLLVVATDHQVVEEIFGTVLMSMFAQIVPLTGTAVSSRHYYKKFSKNGKRPIVQLHGYPESMPDAVLLRRNLQASRVRAVLYAKSSPPACIPPHDFADFRTEKNEGKDLSFIDEFLSERPGILNWSIKKTVRQLMKQEPRA